MGRAQIKTNSIVTARACAHTQTHNQHAHKHATTFSEILVLVTPTVKSSKYTNHRTPPHRRSTRTHDMAHQTNAFK